jgi:hypothetical protein
MNEVKILDGAMSLDESNDVVGLHHHKYAQNGVFKGNAPMMHFTSIRGNSSVQNSSLTTGTNCALQGVSVFIPDCSIVAHATTSSTTSSTTTTSTTTSTTSTTTLPPVWYTLYNCFSGQTDSTMALPPFTFFAGDILSYNNSLFFRVLQQVDTDPGGNHWSLVKTQLTQCPPPPSTSTTISVLTVHGTDYCDYTQTPEHGAVALTITGGSGVYSIAVGYGNIDPNSFVSISGGNINITSLTSPYTNRTGLRNSAGSMDRLIIAVKDTAGGNGSYSTTMYCAPSSTTTTTTTLPTIWYKLYNCASGLYETSAPYLYGTFNIGDRVTYSNIIYFRVDDYYTTDPLGYHWSVTATGQTGCPATTTSTTSTTLSVFTVSATVLCDNNGTYLGKVAVTITGGNGVYSLAAGYGSIGTFRSISGNTFTITSSTNPYDGNTGLRNTTGSLDRFIIAVSDTAGGYGSKIVDIACTYTTTSTTTSTTSTTTTSTTCTPYGTAIGSAYCVNPNTSPTYRQIRADGNCGTYNDDSTNYAACCIPYGTNVGAPYCVNPNVSSTLRQLKADGQCGTYNYDITSCETCCPPYGPTGGSSYCVGTSLFTPYYSGCCSITDVETPNSPTCAEVYVLHDCINPSSAAYSIVYPIGTFAVGDLVTVSGVYYSVYSTTVPSAAGTLVLTSTGQTGCPQYTQLYDRCNQSYYYINTTGISGDGTSSYNPYDCFTVQGVTSTPTGTEIYDWTSVESCNCSG